MNIYQKLVEVRKSVPYLQKEAEGQQYKYVGSSQVLAAVRQKMDDLGLLLIPRVTRHNVMSETVENVDKYNKVKKTTTYFTELDIEFTWVNTEEPSETITIPFYAQGVDIAGEKGVGKALTYGEKYFLLKQFNIATDKDDPDSFQEKAESYRKPEPITPEQLGELKMKVLELSQLSGAKESNILAKLKVKALTDVTTKDVEAVNDALDLWIKQYKQVKKEK